MKLTIRLFSLSIDTMIASPLVAHGTSGFLVPATGEGI